LLNFCIRYNSEGEFKEDTEKSFFAILYLCVVALDYFELFISEEVLAQPYDFLEEWPTFVQKLSNLFGLYLLEDDNEDAIVAIQFPPNSKAVKNFIQFAKYQNNIRWDDRSLRKVVKDALSSHIRDELRFSHEDTSHFEGLKRAVLRIGNDYWKCHLEEKKKFGTVCPTTHSISRTPRQEWRPPITSAKSHSTYTQLSAERTRPSTFQIPASPLVINRSFH